MNRYLSILLAVALVLGLGTNSWAGAPTEQLRTYTDQIQCDCGAILRGFASIDNYVPPLGK